MKQQQAKKDMLLMAVLILISVVLIVWIIPKGIFVSKMMEKEVFTPKTFPNLIAYSMLCVASIGFIKALIEYINDRRENGKAEREKQSAEKRKDAFYIAGMYLLIIVYVIVYKLFGIVIATATVPAVMLWFLKCRNWKSYVAFYVFVALVYVVFTKVLLIPLR